MLHFLRENGFPVDLVFETDLEHEDYRTIVKCDGKEIDTIYSKTMKDRAKYAAGFFKGYECKI